MAMFILLTAGQADHARGPSETDPGASLEPVERAGGVFILGVEVLADPAHAEYREYLAALPQMDSADPEFPGEYEPPES